MRPQPSRIKRFCRALAADGTVTFAPEDFFLHGDERHGREQERHRKRRRQIQARRILKQRPDLRRDRVQPRGQAEDRRRAEERERLEKSQDEAADQRRQRQRQGDGPGDAPFVRAQNLRGVFEIRRNQLTDVGDHRKDIGKAVERHDEDQPRHGENIEERFFRAGDEAVEFIQRAGVGPGEQGPRKRAQERRRHERRHDQGADRFFPRQVRARHQPGKQRADAPPRSRPPRWK